MKRWIAGLIAFTFLTTNVIQDMGGIGIKEAFALEPPVVPAGNIGHLSDASAQAQSFQTDLFTGRAQAGVSIFTPPGRRGLTPQLSLNYSSSGGDSWVGKGWGLEQGFIRRSTDDGIPAYNDSEDTFAFLVQGVSSELVKVDTYEYRAKDESGQFLKFIYQDGYWTVYDKSGTQHIFGMSANARQTNARGIFGWYLERVTDVSDNIMTYAYQHDAGQIYLQAIGYNANANNFPASHYVHFNLEDRPDPLISYRTGERIETNKRLKTIEVKVQDTLARRYELTYEAAPVINRSRLTAVEECGTDEVTCLPQTTFTYQNHGHALEATHEAWPVPNPEENPDYQGYYRNLYVGVAGKQAQAAGLYDVNGDGILDRVVVDMDDTGEEYWEVFYGTTAGFLTDPAIWNVVIPNGFHLFRHLHQWNEEGTYQSFFDLNGDGLQDRLYLNINTEFHTVHVFLNEGNQFSGQDEPMYNIPNIQSAYSFIRRTEGGNSNVWSEFLDIDGDGRVEFVTVDTGFNRWKVYEYEGGDLNPNYTIWNIPNPHDELFQDIRTGGLYSEESTLYDLNGDGLPDRILGRESYNDGLHVYYNKGDGFEMIAEVWPIVIPAGYGNEYRKVRTWSAEGSKNELLDVNGDGLVDRLIMNPGHSNPDEYHNIRVYLNTGSGFTAEPVILENVGRDDTYAYIREHREAHIQAEFNDLDGDGLVERIVRGESQENQWKFFDNQGKHPDLLSTIDNGRGGLTTIEYTPSTRFDNTDSNNIHRLPFPVQVVTKVTQADGLGHEYVTEYSYQGGMFDAPTKEFRGFRETTVTDSEGTKTIHTFLQDEHGKGRPLSVEVRDSQDNVFSREENTWFYDDTIFPGVNFVYLSETNKFIYDGDQTYVRSRQRFEYDTSGNLRVLYDDGEVSTNLDDRRTVHTYVFNETEHLMNTLAVTDVYDHENTLINKKYFYYDGHQDPMQEPVKGLLTASEDLLEGQGQGQGFQTEMVYNDFGNLISITDAREYTTANEYDPTLKLYLTKITNPLGHTQEFTYDPLIAQITESKDQNGQITKTIHDPLGRVVKVISPLDTEVAPTQAIYYDDTSVPNRVITHVKSDTNAPPIGDLTQPNTGYLTTYTFLDGLGREIEKRSPAEDGQQSFDRQIVSGYVVFNDRGQPEKQYVPYLADFQTGFAIPPAEFPHAVFTYDAVGRRTEIEYPDGTSSSVVFDDLIKTSIDPNNHVKRYTQNVFGNLVKVEECEDGASLPFCAGGTIYTTQYEYDALNRLVKTIDHANNTTTVAYDLLGRKTGMDDPDMGVWSYTYDENNNLLTQTDALLQTITFEYDELNRLKKKIYPDLSEVNYVYDDCPPVTCGGLDGENYPAGRLLKVNDPSGTHLFRYDKLGRVIQDQKTLGDGNDYSFTRIYDPLGRVITLEYPDAEFINLTFNGMGEAETMTLVHEDETQSAIVSNVDYNASGQITKIEYGNGVTTDYTYNPQTLRLEHLLTSHQTQGTYQDLTYAFDNVGNVLSLVDAINTNTQSFLYDDLDRLIQAAGSYGTRPYDHDAIGNLTQKGDASLEYNDMDHPHALTRRMEGEEVIDYVYDANGNMTMRGTEVLTYDYDNRLTRVTEAGTTKGIYQYDATGQRVKKTAGNQTIYYLGKDVEIEYNTQPTSSLIRKSFFLGNTRIAEEEHAIPSGLQFACAVGTPCGEIDPVHHLRFFHQDHLGSTNIITNEQGQQTLLMEYFPFGEVKVRTGSDPVTHTFTGHEEDLETDLIYANARYYDPKIGRFITPDTYVQSPEDPQSLNRYAYARNNPVKYVDPTGNFWFLIGILIGALIGAAVNVAFQAAFGNIHNFRDFFKSVIVGATAGATAAAGGLALGAAFSTLGVTGGALATTLGDLAVVASSAYTSNGVDNVLSGRNFNDHALQVVGLSVATFGVAKAAGPAIQKGVQGLQKALKPAFNAIKSGIQRIPGVNSIGQQLRSTYDDILGNEFGHARITFNETDVEKKLVIGEGMQRVRDAAGKLGAEVFEAGSDQSLWMKENRKWIFQKMREGFKVYDIGPQKGRPIPSKYYAMEQKALRRTQYPVQRYQE